MTEPQESVASENQTQPTKASGKRMVCSRMPEFMGLIIGIVLGVGGTIAVGWLMMPSMMLTTHQSRYATVDETTEALKTAIEEAGWRCPAIRNMNTAMEEGGYPAETPYRIVELCKAEYAHDVLADNPEMSTLMPCAFGVYEGKDGKVYITGMNTGLMGKMFGGTVARVMGESVAKDEAAILQKVTVQ